MNGPGGLGGSGAPGRGAGPDPLTALRSGRISDRETRLRTATKLLEGTFYQEVMKAMRATIPEGGVISGGMGQDLFEGMLDQTFADAAASESERGIGAALYRTLARGGASAAEGSGPTLPADTAPGGTE